MRAQVPNFYEATRRYNENSAETELSLDCALAPFSRCVERLRDGNATEPECQQMRCTKSGGLLINGEPCNVGALLCANSTQPLLLRLACAGAAPFPSVHIRVT